LLSDGIAAGLIITRPVRIASGLNDGAHLVQYHAQIANFVAKREELRVVAVPKPESIPIGMDWHLACFKVGSFFGSKVTKFVPFGTSFFRCEDEWVRSFR
jgi:hypothetical protein